MAMVPAAMADVEPSDSGLASGVVNTSFMMGGALGLAALASLAQAESTTLAAAGSSAKEALLGGYHRAFVVGAAFTAAALGRGVWLVAEDEQMGQFVDECVLPADDVPVRPPPAPERMLGL